jgi:hypothetical protein
MPLRYWWLSYRLPMNNQWFIDQYTDRKLRDRHFKERGELGYIVSKKRYGEMPVKDSELGDRQT